MVKHDKTFPTMDCSACICTPKMSEAGNHPTSPSKRSLKWKKLPVILEILKLLFAKKAKYIDYDLCTGCGACETKCPSKTINEFDEGLSERTAIYKPFAQAVPSKPTIDAASCRKLKEGKCGVCAKVAPPTPLTTKTKTKHLQKHTVRSFLPRAITLLTGPNFMANTAQACIPISFRAFSSSA